MLLAAVICLIGLTALVRRPRATVCVLAVVSAAHAAGLVGTPAPVRHARHELADWQDHQAERIECHRLLAVREEPPAACIAAVVE